MGPECLTLAESVLAGVAQPYWGLPFPTPYEAEVIRWLVGYGYVASDKATSCKLSLGQGDMSIYDANQWRGWFDTVCQLGGGGSGAACAGVVTELKRYNVPFAEWMKRAADSGQGVVLAGRVAKIDPMTGQTSWDVNAAEFFAPTVEDDLPLGLLGAVVPPQLAAGLKTYLAALKAILMARAGRLGAAKELFIVYAPALANLGVPLPALYGLGEGGVVVTLPPVPTFPPFQISYPDGRGGVITIGTSAPPPTTPPPGAPPLKPPDKAGLPPERLGEWVQFVGGGLGALVAAGTLYLMFKKRGAKK